MQMLVKCKHLAERGFRLRTGDDGDVAVSFDAGDAGHPEQVLGGERGDAANDLDAVLRRVAVRDARAEGFDFGGSALADDAALVDER
jgi:hypothetical protein